MGKRCEICNININDDSGKLNGTIIKARNENNQNELIYVCSECQKQDGWIEKAKIKGV